MCKYDERLIEGTREYSLSNYLTRKILSKVINCDARYRSLSLLLIFYCIECPLLLTQLEYWARLPLSCLALDYISIGLYMNLKTQMEMNKLIKAALV